jgi:hypothetical protein
MREPILYKLHIMKLRKNIHSMHKIKMNTAHTAQLLSTYES